ncbi:hypothetical protein BGZ73_008533 [Actinomortierella ambigua]|nr:hypothetical protein BGZ73_008533 [Actinomortierella ambigua]
MVKKTLLTLTPLSPEASPDDVTVTSNASDSLDKSTFELWDMNVCSQIELPRYILSFVGASFKTCTSDAAESTGSEAKLPTPRLRHIMSDDNVFELNGVHVIIRYLAKLFELDGQTARDSAMLDMVFSRTTDIVQQWIDQVYSKPNPRSVDNFEQFLTQVGPALDALENILAKNVSDSYFCGASTTYPDLAYFTFMSLLFDCHPKLTAKAISSTVRPVSKRLYRRLKGDDSLAALTWDNPWKHHSCSRILSLHTVGFLSSDIQQSLKFYTDMFGFNCISKDIDPQNQKLGTIEFELPKTNIHLAIAATSGVQPRSLEAGQGAFALVVTNVKDLVAFLVDNNVRVLTQPETHPSGHLARIYDPDNNRITLIDHVAGTP